jgi:hypothetical protein
LPNRQILGRPAGWSMTRKSGYRFSEKIMLKQLEHDPEKWIPVFRKDHAQAIKG